MKKLKALLFILTLLFILSFIPYINANSANPYYEGTTSSGIFVSGNDSVINVEGEELVFNLEDSLNNEVSATYTLKNTLDANITSQFYFPFLIVDYLNYYNTELKYDVNIKRESSDFESVDKKVRLAKINEENYLDTLTNFTNTYKTFKYMNKEYSYSDIIYIYTVSFDVENKDDWNEIKILNNNILTNSSYKLIDGEKYIYINKNTYQETLYSFEKINDISSCLGLQDGCKINKSTIESDTFYNICLSKIGKDYYNNDIIKQLLTKVEVMDLYNYYVDFLNENHKYAYQQGLVSYDRFDNCMFFYDYKIDFKPYETLQNTVITSIFPTVNLRMNPNSYEYTYYLNPASTFNSFKNLKITIKTSDYNKYILSSTLPYTEVTDGYEMTFDSLPDKDLIFTLCATQSPKVNKTNNFLFLIVIGVVILVLGIIIGLCVILSILISIINKKEPVNIKKSILISENVIIILSTILSIVFPGIIIFISCFSTLLLLILTFFDGSKIKSKYFYFIILFAFSLILSVVLYRVFSSFYENNAFMIMAVVLIHVFLIAHFMYNIKMLKKKNNTNIEEKIENDFNDGE